MTHHDTKSSADLEREVAAQRDRVEARIGEIKDRLSPGQLLDEALSYTRHGGAHFASNLAQQVSANPLPAALVGVGLAWLISSTANGQQNQNMSQHHWDDRDHSYPYANLRTGGLRRISHAADESGQWWSEFQTDSGDIYKARASEAGHRAGHFTDKAGRMFSGFIDDAGNRVRQFQDEAGNAISDAQGWANHSWRDLQQGIGNALNGVGSAARQAMDGAMSGSRNLAGGMQGSADEMSRQIVKLFDNQPLIAGALAFAAGAAIGATLPSTAEEDQLVGEQSDRLRERAGRKASKLYEKGKEQVSEVFETAKEKTEEVYSDAKRQLTEPEAGRTPVRH